MAIVKLKKQQKNMFFNTALGIPWISGVISGAQKWNYFSDCKKIEGITFCLIKL